MEQHVNNFLSAGKIDDVTANDIIEAAKRINADKKRKKQEKLKKQREEEKEKVMAEMKGIKMENIVHGDSLITVKDCPNGIRLILTDPSYGQNRVSNRRTESAKDGKIMNDGDIDTSTNLLTGVLQKLYPKMADDSHVLCFSSHRYEPEFRDAISRVGFRYKSSLIRNKPNHGAGDLGGFAPKHEIILNFVKGNPKISPRIDDVLEGKKFVTNHSCKKPIDLLMKLINSTTIEGELVVDPFAGHGSTAIACKRTGRNFRVSEIDEYNYSQIKKNLLSY